MIVIYTDGGARNNPGPAGAGVVIYDLDRMEDGAAPMATVSKYLGKQTNNWAEYEAVALALEKAKDLGLTKEPIEVRMDSKLVAEQLSGNWRVKEPSLKPQFEKVRALCGEFAGIRFVHVPREKNKEADKLVNRAIDQSGH